MWDRDAIQPQAGESFFSLPTVQQIESDVLIVMSSAAPTAPVPPPQPKRSKRLRKAKEVLFWPFRW